MNIKRYQDLINRWEELFDKNYSFHTVFKDVSNKELYFKEKILEEVDYNLAEERMVAIEEVDAKWKVEYEKQKYEEQFDVLRKQAWKYLRETDWSQAPDEPLDTEQKKEYREYRKYLRNIDLIWKNKQIKEHNVMNFEEWKKNPPKFKYEPSEVWYIKE